MRSIDRVGAALIAAAICALSFTAVADAPSPYAGLKNRDIKSLSRRETDDLLNGRGMSLALAAELNGYPGPRHVLEHASALALTAEQRSLTMSLVRRMEMEAISLGVEIVAHEAKLDRLFAGSTVTERRLETVLATIARARGRLRMTHLKYHLAMRDALSETQIARYMTLRGYGATRDASPSHSMEHHK